MSKFRTWRPHRWSWAGHIPTQMTYSTTRYRINPDRHLSLRASSAAWWPCTTRYDRWAHTPSTSSPYRPSTGSVTGLRRRQSWPPPEKQVTWRFTNLYPAESRQNNSTTSFFQNFILLLWFLLCSSPRCCCFSWPEG